MHKFNTSRVQIVIATLMIFIDVIVAQKQVAITIDDVPNVKKYKIDRGMSLLKQIDFLNIPVTIFINEQRLSNGPDPNVNAAYLRKWIENPNVIIGTHTYSHLRYSQVTLDSFKSDVIRGMKETKELASPLGKTIDYFRFPYNDAGKDEQQHKAAQDMLDSIGLISTPFTVESSDWMFNALYEYYLAKDSIVQAKKILSAYIGATMRSFEWMDTLTAAQYGRSVKHIFLCHDNAITADCLPSIIDLLRKKGYEIIDLNMAMKDPIYTQESHYYKKWGISWVYRWIDDPERRQQLMKEEPGIMPYYELYQRILSGEGY